MKLQYTLAELAAEITALEQVFGNVTLIEPYQGGVLNPATLEPTGETEELTALDAAGRGARMQQTETGIDLVLYQAVQVEERSCILLQHCTMPHILQESAGAENALYRALAQVEQELRRDYLTGAYNARYLNSEYRRYAEQAAQAGRPVGVVMARVNEYWNLRQEESTTAADRSLVMAAGILQLACGTAEDKAVLARLEDALFAVVTVGAPAAEMAATLQNALESSRREFNVSLSRRSSFTVDVASAEWGEAPAWDMLLALAQQRL